MKNTDIILRAADFIEKHPAQYDFHEIHTPMTKHECGCPLGWIGYFIGNIPPSRRGSDFIVLDDQARLIGMTGADEFYARMNDIESVIRNSGESIKDWMRDAPSAARCLRELAKGENHAN